MKFIDQKRCHIPADTAFVRRKYLDIRYAPQGDWMLPTFYTPDGKWKTEADKDSSPSNYPGMVFTESSEQSADKGPTEGMLLEAQIFISLFILLFGIIKLKMDSGVMMLITALITGILLGMPAKESFPGSTAAANNRCQPHYCGAGRVPRRPGHLPAYRRCLLGS